ncbi:MAG TPA: four helix bundle protein [bacterium]|nr:MAG: hypothetical protein BWY28_02202 [bacterium ADurb.Bin236]HOY64691.1 four helix bundle protein [bacterium]HPI76366.1 four helix bundle protein [bacterium]HPN93703.1 four helix bundle protein [bacterium]
MATISNFTDLVVWQKAHSLVLNIYKTTGAFPAEERYGLVSQMRRAAVSVPANIAEGFKKRGLKDKANYYNIAQASLEELRYYLILAKDLDYIESNSDYISNISEVSRMLHGLIESLK